MARGNGPETGAGTQALLDDRAFPRELVRTTLQTLLEEELAAHLGATPYERTAGRTGDRNGYKPRLLTTRVGKIELRVPQDRDGTFSPVLCARDQQSEQAWVLTLMEMYVHGVSTRKVREVTEALCGPSFSFCQACADVSTPRGCRRDSLRLLCTQPGTRAGAA